MAFGLRRRATRRHDRRRRQRLRHRGQAPALRACRHRPARRPVGDHGDRRRRRRRRARRRRPARPGRARPDLALGPDLPVRGLRPPRRSTRPSASSSELGRRRRRAGVDATTARSSSPPTARRPPQVADAIAPEHLEIHAADEAWWLARLRNYGSLFLGSLTHGRVLGQGHDRDQPRAADRSRRALLRRALRAALPQDAHLPAHRPTRRPRAPLAEAVAEISAAEGLPAHGATATRRLARL